MLLGLAGLGAEHSAPHVGEDTVPTSNWAEVYSSDSTDYREPVVEESQYPVAESASRSDWFESYPYQRFEERRDGPEGPGLLETLGQSVASSVDEVRSKVAGVGEGVVNGALRLVGAETLREKQEKQERAREGRPDPLIDFSLDLSYGLPGLGGGRYYLGSSPLTANPCSIHKFLMLRVRQPSVTFIN
jgi:hypothetical protein